jgi:hypothetical protein
MGGSKPGKKGRKDDVKSDKYYDGKKPGEVYYISVQYRYK